MHLKEDIVCSKPFLSAKLIIILLYQITRLSDLFGPKQVPIWAFNTHHRVRCFMHAKNWFAGRSIENKLESLLLSHFLVIF